MLKISGVIFLAITGSLLADFMLPGETPSLRDMFNAIKILPMSVIFTGGIYVDYFGKNIGGIFVIYGFLFWPVFGFVVFKCYKLKSKPYLVALFFVVFGACFGLVHRYWALMSI